AYEQFHLANIRDSTTTSSCFRVSLHVTSRLMGWRFASAGSPFEQLLSPCFKYSLLLFRWVRRRMEGQITDVNRLDTLDGMEKAGVNASRDREPKEIADLDLCELSDIGTK